jgi:hypothetical protein
MYNCKIQAKYLFMHVLLDNREGIDQMANYEVNGKSAAGPGKGKGPSRDITWLLFFLAIFISVQTFGFGGIVSASAAIEISTPESFAYALTNDPYGTFELQSDLDLTGILEQPIPEFHGVLWGHGHKITYSLLALDAEDVGLFGVNRGTVSDLNLVVDLTVLNKDSRVGGLCGTNTGIIKNVRVQGTIIAEQCSYVGGLVGYWVRQGSYTLSKL